MRYFSNLYSQELSAILIIIYHHQSLSTTQLFAYHPQLHVPALLQPVIDLANIFTGRIQRVLPAADQMVPHSPIATTQFLYVLRLATTVQFYVKLYSIRHLPLEIVLPGTRHHSFTSARTLETVLAQHQS